MKEKIEQVIAKLVEMENEATKASMRAIEDYDIGRMAGRANGYRTAIKMLREAIESDTQSTN